MTWQSIEALIEKHQDALGLFALAMAVTMAEKLPWPFYKLEMLEWAYEWLRRGLLTFVSFRGPAHSETQSRLSVEGGKTEISTKTESSSPEPPPAAIPKDGSEVKN